jgi:HEAT repeat protein
MVNPVNTNIKHLSETLWNWFETDEKRQEAAKLLGETGDKHAVVSLLEILNYELKPAIKSQVIISLGNMGDMSAYNKLMAISRTDKNEEIKRLAAAAAESIHNRHKQSGGSASSAKKKKAKKPE